MFLDLFAGPGGWDEGARMVGVGPVVGLDIDEDACRTALLAGHARVQCDVASYPTEPFVGKVDGIVASPPCTDFSEQGFGAGITGKSGRLMWQVPRWVSEVRPRWFACEQVPSALPWWERFGQHLADLGYAWWSGYLNAADYGVPQTRKRAFLLGRLDVDKVTPPAPTHAKDPPESLFEPVRKWVSVAEALGEEAKSGWVVNTGRDWKKKGDRKVAQTRAIERPAPTIDGKGWWHLVGPDDESVSIPNEQMLLLQSFRADYPVVGIVRSKKRQVGNAVPPLLAAAIIESLAR